MKSEIRNLGFTIIELLVVMAVIVVFMGLSLAAYAKFNQRQVLQISGQNFKKILRDVQSRAYTSEVDCDICDCTANTIATLEGWYVDFSTSEIYGYCNNNAFSRTSFNLPAGIVVTPHITPPTQIFFRSYPPSSDQNAVICLSDPALPDYFYVIRVNKAGEITDEGKLVATCNP